MIRHVARPLLGSIFVYSGYQALVHPQPVAEAAEPLIDTASDIAQSVSTRSVSEPQSAPPGQGVDNHAQGANKQALARAYGGVQLGAGLMLATGRFPRPASLVLAGSLVPATATHSFWNEADPAARQDQTVHFLKNLSLMGGLLIAGFDTEGKPGVMWRARRAATRVSDQATRISGGSDDKPIAQYAETAKSAAAHTVEHLDDAATVVGEKLSDAVDRAKPVLSKTAAQASDAAAEIGSAVGRNLRELQAEAPQLASGAERTARRTARKARRQTRRHAANLRDKADALRTAD
ncbi:DoxX family protein [Jongsikchunia kroppenstedtii]|uniref:DoxX family protein n=1 Tax=Jongsikchunia kroppenstedtii TaxID=1121721 RepID=UPI0003A95F7B|nr:DoxX family protein [Jongsikchunia kroppenstedtii]